MKIVVVSDDHGRKDLLDKVYHLHENADLFLHAGDSQNLQTNILPFLSVKGNNDRYIDNLYRKEKVGSFNILMLHGHTLFICKDELYNYAKEHSANILIFGHIHRPYYEIIEGIHIICPGSLSYPRSKYGCTYAIINIEEKNVEVKFCNI